MTRFLTVMDPLLGVNPAGDTTFDFLLESQARGVENLVCGIADLWSESSAGFARARPATVRRPTPDNKTHATLGAHVDVAFDDVDVIWMRKDPPVDDAFLLACMMLDRHDPTRTLVLNNPSSLRVANEKLWGLFADEVTPKSLVSARPDLLVAFVKRNGKGVLKPIGLAGGMGVLAFAADDPNLRSAADLLTNEGKRAAIAQEYLPAVKQGDKRVILLDGEPIGAVLRVPRSDDVRANLHVGGTAQKATVDDADRRIATLLGPQLRALGLFFVGIDVIGGKLTEVNVTSPTGVQEIDRLDGRTGKDRISAQVMDAVFARLAKRPTTR